MINPCILCSLFLYISSPSTIDNIVAPPMGFHLVFRQQVTGELRKWSMEKIKIKIKIRKNYLFLYFKFSKLNWLKKPLKLDFLSPLLILQQNFLVMPSINHLRCNSYVDPLHLRTPNSLNLSFLIRTPLSSTIIVIHAIATIIVASCPSLCFNPAKPFYFSFTIDSFLSYDSRQNQRQDKLTHTRSYNINYLVMFGEWFWSWTGWTYKCSLIRFEENRKRSRSSESNGWTRILRLLGLNFTNTCKTNPTSSLENPLLL